MSSGESSPSSFEDKLEKRIHSQIRRDNIARYCECSGVFENTVDAADLVREAATAYEIGEEFELPITVEVSRWMTAGVEVIS